MRSFCTWRDTQVIDGYPQNLIFQFHFAGKIKQNIKQNPKKCEYIVRECTPQWTSVIWVQHASSLVAVHYRLE